MAVEFNLLARSARIFFAAPAHNAGATSVVGLWGQRAAGGARRCVEQHITTLSRGLSQQEPPHKSQQQLGVSCGERVKAFLAQRSQLRVHEAQAQVQPTAAGTPWLGFVVGPERTRVKGRKVVEATRRLAHWHGCWQRAECSFAELDARVQGWLAHVAQADSWHLRERVLSGLPLTRA